MHEIRIRLAGLFASAGLLLALSGCGYKSNPVPPQAVVPEPIQDLSYTLEPDGAHLKWTYPDEGENGRNLQEIASFDLYRAEVPLDGYCPGCPIPFGKPLEIPGGVVEEESPTKGEYVSGMLRSGNKYFFKMTSRISWLAASKDSNIISFVYHLPAAAPVGLIADSKDGTVKLNWRKVTLLTDGSPADLPVTYQVLKSTDGKQYTPLGVPLELLSADDRDVEGGKTYYYKVISGMLFQGEPVDGSASKPVTVTVADVVPPDQVTGVTVVAAASNVRIFWDASSVDDLAGYRIYRRAPGQNAPEKIGEVVPTQTIFKDETGLDAPGSFYSVAAYDREGNEGERSEEVTTRF